MIDFGFRVDKIDRESGDPSYCVSLPHQCDRWYVAGDDGFGVPKALGIQQLTEFIEQANKALEELIKE